MNIEDLEISVSSVGKFGDWVRIRVKHVPTGLVEVGEGPFHLQKVTAQEVIKKLEKRLQGKQETLPG